MPSLPQFLRKPHLWLGLLLALVSLLVVDVARPAESQVTPHLYGASTASYRWCKGKAGCEGCCRFTPTCSVYSEEAVQKFGVIKGLAMTLDRLQRCKTNVPMGTPDHVGEEAGTALVELKSERVSR